MSIYFWVSIDCFLHAEECRYSIRWQWVSAHANLPYHDPLNSTHKSLLTCHTMTPKFNPHIFANLPYHDP